MEEHYQIMVENMNSGIFIFDKNGIILEINKKIEKIFGCDRALIIGKDFRKFVAENEVAYATVQLQKLLREKHIGPNVGYIKQPDGSLIQVEFSAEFVSGKNESFFLSTVHDMSLNNDLRSKSILSDKLEIVGALAAGIIHEINNPITWILTNLSYTKDKIKSAIGNPSEQADLFKKLIEVTNESIEGAERIRDIVQDLKKYIRVEEEQTVLVNIHDEINSAIHLISPVYRNSVVIETHFDSHIPLVLLATGRLKQVFVNLLVNAAQAMHSESSQNVINISTQIDNDKIKIIVKDNGKGIAPDILNKIFDPFFTTKTSGIGTGLGLSICNEIIRKVGGEITVDSVQGEGATFTIYLPIQLKITDEATLGPSKKIISRKKIIVVDDEPTLLMVIKRILERDHEVITCHSRAAIELIQQGIPFDAIITDLNMPDISGIDIFNFVSKMYPGFEKFIIFTTGGYDAALAKNFLSNADNICLEKPFTPDQLKQAILKTFNGQYKR